MRTVNKALFLDLDGTVIITKSGKTFAENKEDWQFNGSILKKIEEYVDKGYFIMIVSNQGGIETGVVKLNDFRHKLRRVVNDIIVHTGCPMDRIGSRFTVTNNPEDFYRLPNPGMAYDLALAYILNLSESVMVGNASGRVRKRETVFYDQTSISNWSHQNGSHLTDKEAAFLVVAGPEAKTATIEVRDFSDSDLRFAMSAGMAYVDVTDFLFDYMQPRRIIEKY